MNLITFQEECIDFTSLLIEVMTQNGKIKDTSSLPLLVRMRDQRLHLFTFLQQQEIGNSFEILDNRQCKTVILYVKEKNEASPIIVSVSCLKILRERGPRQSPVILTGLKRWRWEFREVKRLEFVGQNIGESKAAESEDFWDLQSFLLKSSAWFCSPEGCDETTMSGERACNGQLKQFQDITKHSW